MICLRCNNEFNNPFPKATFPNENLEIATTEFCAKCNAYTMAILFRGSSAYRPIKMGELQVPHINIPKEISDAMLNPKPRPLCAQGCGRTAYVYYRKHSYCFECVREVAHKAEKNEPFWPWEKKQKT